MNTLLYIILWFYNRAGGFPSTDHQFDDVLLMRKAKQLGMPFTSGMVEYGRTAKQLQLVFACSIIIIRASFTFATKGALS